MTRTEVERQRRRTEAQTGAEKRRCDRERHGKAQRRRKMRRRGLALRACVVEEEEPTSCVIKDTELGRL